MEGKGPQRTQSILPAVKFAPKTHHPPPANWRPKKSRPKKRGSSPKKRGSSGSDPEEHAKGARLSRIAKHKEAKKLGLCDSIKETY